MKQEVEARLLDINVDEFISKLEATGAIKVGDWLQVRKCFDFLPARKNSWIRLRTNGVETTLTIKEIVNDKINGTNESEIVVSDFATTEEILNKLGYVARSTQENRRIRYVLDGVEIDIDFWPLIPTYAEFESETEDQIKNVCKKLNVEFENLVTIDVSSVYNHYGIDINFLPQIILLEDNRKSDWGTDEKLKKFHTMNLNAEYFELIKQGEKIFEGRLNDEKRKAMNVGDVITFFKEPERVESFDAIITQKIEFKDFDQMSKVINKKDLGFDEKTRQEMLDVYHSFYSKEDEEKYGVVAIKVVVKDK